MHFSLLYINVNSDKFSIAQHCTENAFHRKTTLAYSKSSYAYIVHVLIDLTYMGKIEYVSKCLGKISLKHCTIY